LSGSSPARERAWTPGFCRLPGCYTRRRKRRPKRQRKRCRKRSRRQPLLPAGGESTLWRRTFRVSRWNLPVGSASAGSGQQELRQQRDRLRPLHIAKRQQAWPHQRHVDCARQAADSLIGSSAHSLTVNRSAGGEPRSLSTHAPLLDAMRFQDRRRTPRTCGTSTKKGPAASEEAHPARPHRPGTETIIHLQRSPGGRVGVMLPQRLPRASPEC
jgi:hypothetical protein